MELLDTDTCARLDSDPRLRGAYGSALNLLGVCRLLKDQPEVAKAGLSEAARKGEVCARAAIELLKRSASLAEIESLIQDARDLCSMAQSIGSVGAASGNVVAFPHRRLSAATH